MKVFPIGMIHTPFKRKDDMPIQPAFSKAAGRVEVFEKYADGLKDIDGFSHIVLIYRFHKARGYCLHAKPFLDTEKRGLFATRYCRRPNQIGMSIVKMIRREKNILFVKHIDTLDGTPLLDIKPYVPDFEPKGLIKVGWYKKTANINVRKQY